VNNRLDEAIASYNTYKEMLPEKESYLRKYANQQIEACNLASEFMSAPDSVLFENLGEVIIYSNFEVSEYSNNVCDDDIANRLILDLKNSKLDAVVRGTFGAAETLKCISKVFDVDNIRRIALLETKDKKMFILCPVGVNDGWETKQKIEFVKDAAMFLNLLNLEPLKRKRSKIL